jgi:signal transduction histidine kinase
VLADLEVRIEKAGGWVDIGELPTIEADPTQMRQLLQNLIGNALKFHRDDVIPVVAVRAHFANGHGDHSQGAEHANHCRITVEDNGIGFDEKYVDRIFQVFQRLHGRGEYEGTGIGLATARKIVERHGGTITAKSTPGQGSTFIVTLPITQTQEEATL